MPMNTNLGINKILLRLTGRALPLSLLLVVGCATSRAQAVAESAAVSSASGGVNTQARTIVDAPHTTPDSHRSSQHLGATSGPPAEVTNRQALEQRAGRDACKLLLRSTPNGALVWIDGAFVGNTPLLLLVHPGKYQIQMRGPRLEFAKQVVALLPRETQEIALGLAVRYPLRVAVH